jgi:YHS domain-containing protein
MKHFSLLVALATMLMGALAVPPAAAAAAKPAPKTAAKGKAREVKVGDKAVCCVCAVKEGSKKPEEVKAVLKYKGKTYPFCSLDEKAEFISNPSKYAGAVK